MHVHREDLKVVHHCFAYLVWQFMLLVNVCIDRKCLSDVCYICWFVDCQHFLPDTYHFILKFSSGGLY